MLDDSEVARANNSRQQRGKDLETYDAPDSTIDPTPQRAHTMEQSEADDAADTEDEQQKTLTKAAAAGGGMRKPAAAAASAATSSSSLETKSPTKAAADSSTRPMNKSSPSKAAPAPAVAAITASKETPSSSTRKPAMAAAANGGGSSSKEETKVAAQSDDNSDDEGGAGKKPLLDQPLEIEGKRARRTTERLVLTRTDSSTSKKPAYSMGGAGIPLGDIPYVSAGLKKQGIESLRTLNRVIFKTQGQAANMRRRIRMFNGFDFDAKSDDFERRRLMMLKMTRPELSEMRRIFGLPKHAKKEDEVDAVLAFLLNPVDSGKTPRLPVKRKCATGSSSKTQSKKPKKDLKADIEDDAESGKEEDEEDREEKKREMSDDERDAGGLEKEDEREDEEEEEEEEEKKAVKVEKSKSAQSPKKQPRKKTASKSRATPKKAVSHKSNGKAKKNTKSASIEKEDEEEDLEENDDGDDEETIGATNGEAEAKDAEEVSRAEGKDGEEKSVGKKQRRAKEKGGNEPHSSSSHQEDLLPPTDAQIVDKIQELLNANDLTTMTMTMMRKSVVEAFPHAAENLEGRRVFIKAKVQELVNKMQRDRGE